MTMSVTKFVLYIISREMNFFTVVFQLLTHSQTHVKKLNVV